ncbi:MAG: PIN domain-containing protein [Lacipirellulaceae bacterium]
MNKALLDTDIFSEVLKGKDAAVRLRSIAYRKAFGRYSIAAPSVTEIVGGLTQARHEQQLEAFRQMLRSVEVFSLGAIEADLAGEITGALARVGTPVGVIDPMIAAVAISRRLTLVTGNTQHFERIAALGYPLSLDNWRSA